jgi:hypothetical protein
MGEALKGADHLGDSVVTSSEAKQASDAIFLDLIEAVDPPRGARLVVFGRVRGVVTYLLNQPAILLCKVFDGVAQILHRGVDFVGESRGHVADDPHPHPMVIAAAGFGQPAEASDAYLRVGQLDEFCRGEGISSREMGASLRHNRVCGDVIVGGGADHHFEIRGDFPEGRCGGISAGIWGDDRQVDRISIVGSDARHRGGLLGDLDLKSFGLKRYLESVGSMGIGFDK